MRRWRLVLVAAMAAAVPALAVADGTDVDSVTGGGEVALSIPQSSSGPGEGPGDTISFTARQAPGTDSVYGDLAAEGEVQIVERPAGRTDAVVIHGKVLCLNVGSIPFPLAPATSTEVRETAALVFQPERPNLAPLRGLYLIDNDAERGQDNIAYFEVPDNPDCAIPTMLPMQFGRGEVQIHDAE